MRKTITRIVIVLALAAGLSAVEGVGPASAGPKDARHCIAPERGDLNEIYGVAEAIVMRFCTEVDAGERWTHATLWLMSPSFEATPEGFVPAGATPLDDFKAKFVGVRYVIDEGTRQQRTQFDANSSRLWTGAVEGLPAVSSVSLSSLHPLSVGTHTVSVYWVFNGMHCDGLAANVDENCLPAGDLLYTTTTFDVVPAKR